MRRCLLLPIVIICLGGCAASKPAVQQAAAAATPNAPSTNLVSPDQLASLPAGRYCQVTGSDPRARYEGTIVRASAKELVLTDVVTRSVDPVPILGQLPFRWSRRKFSSVEIAAKEGEVKIRRSKIAAVNLFDAEEGQRRLAEQRDWRAELGRSGAKPVVLASYQDGE